MSSQTPPARLPRTSGTYALILNARVPRVVRAGGLGPIHLPRGWYAYTGSAFGPGGLAARAGRHLRQNKKQRWHVDYLTAGLSVSRVWYTTFPEKRECAWAKLFLDMGGTPVKGFGSSDCRCPAHLFHFFSRPGLARFRAIGAAPVSVIRVFPDPA